MTSDDAIIQLKQQEDQKEQKNSSMGKKLLPKQKARALTKAAMAQSDSESDAPISLHDESNDCESDDYLDERFAKKPRITPSAVDKLKLDQLQVQDIVVRDFVTAVYESEWFIGQVSAVTEEPDLCTTHPYTINYMEHIGTNQFRWPKKPDTLLTNKDDILTKVQ